MGPKVEAAAQFVNATGRPAAIGTLSQLVDVIAGTKGTRVEPAAAIAATAATT
jgi:carbamate kinase